MGNTRRDVVGSQAYRARLEVNNGRSSQPRRVRACPTVVGMSESGLTSAIDAVADLMRGRVSVAVTGAGISTDAGLPDYRGQGSTDVPSVDYDQFVSDPVWQRWVWQRNQETWGCASRLAPTPGHLALARLERAGLVNGVATQNIDGLHERAGSAVVHELHGTYKKVRCLDCGAVMSREAVDAQMRRLNPDVVDDPDPRHVAILATATRPEAEASNFVVAPCPRCGGLLKPAVVFFGEMLPQDEMSAAYALARQADVCLIVGTSLAVMTGMYVAIEAINHGADIVVINRGPTAADTYARVRIDAGASEVLEGVANTLLGKKD